MVILAGIASFYLSAPEAHTEFAQPVARRTLDRLGATSAPILAVMRLKRRIVGSWPPRTGAARRKWVRCPKIHS
jgi:hypothetical protein